MYRMVLFLLLFAQEAFGAAPAPVFASVPEGPFSGFGRELRLEQDVCYTWGTPAITVTSRDVRVTQTVTPIAGCTGTTTRRATIALPRLDVGAYRLTYAPEAIGFEPMPQSIVEFASRPNPLPGYFVQEPYEPVALEPITMHMHLFTPCDAIHGVRLVGSAIRIELDQFNANVCDYGDFVSYTIGAFPPGTYRVELAYLPEDGGEVVDFVDVVVKPGPASTAGERGRPIEDLSGLWHSPNEEPSTGITFIHVREPAAAGETSSRLRVYGIWYRYGADGTATWYWVDAYERTPGQYAGPVYAYRERDSTAPGFRRAIDATDVGSMSIRFGGLNEPARVFADVDGEPIEFALQRFRFTRAAWPAKP